MGFSIRTYQLKDDSSQVLAANSQELVEVLRDGGRFTQDESVADYMLGFATRFYIQCGTRIRSDNADVFLADLLAVGFLTELKCSGSCLPHGVREEQAGWMKELYCNGCGRLMDRR